MAQLNRLLSFLIIPIFAVGCLGGNEIKTKVTPVRAQTPEGVSSSKNTTKAEQDAEQSAENEEDQKQDKQEEVKVSDVSEESDSPESEVTEEEEVEAPLAKSQYSSTPAVHKTGLGTIAKQKLAEKTEETPISSSHEVTAIRQVLVGLRSGHSVFADATRLHFKVQDASEASMSILKEIQWYLKEHIVNEEFQSIQDGCDSAQGRKKSELIFSGNKENPRMDLYVHSCDSEAKDHAFTAVVLEQGKKLKFTFVNEAIPSSKKAWIHLLFSKGQCTLTMKPGEQSEVALASMDCGSSRSKCAIAAHAGMTPFEGLAMGMKSNQAGQTQIAIFERLMYKTSQQGSAAKVADFYGCAHSYLQKRQTGGLDLFELQFSAEGRFSKEGKIQIAFDYSAAEEEAARRQELAEEQEEKEKVTAEKAASEKKGSKNAETANAIQCPSASQFVPMTPEELDQLSLQEMQAYEAAFQDHQKKIRAPCPKPEMAESMTEGAEEAIQDGAQDGTDQ